MRLSPQRHTLAKLRAILGLSQKEMANLAGCSWPTIQAVELGKLKLSHGLGTRIAFRTGLNPNWLIENELGKEPTTPDGRLYTKGEFEQVQAQLLLPPSTEAQAARLLKDVWDIFGANVRMLASLFAYAHLHGQFPMCAYKASQEVQRLIRAQVTSPEKADAMIQGARIATGSDCCEEITKALAGFFAETKKNSQRPKGSRKL
jgi:DNA-binding XRE family transcriptional regulator